jgi:hypothetical protein
LSALGGRATLAQSPTHLPADDVRALFVV